MRSVESEQREFTKIANESVRLMRDGARALVASGVQRDECVLASAMLLITYARLAGFNLEEVTRMVADNWEEGCRQLALRGWHPRRRVRS